MRGVADTAVRDLSSPDGRTLRTYSAGVDDGDLVVVHHGTPCSGTLASWWAADADRRGIRLVGYDRPGYGGSDRDALRTVAAVAADTALIADAYGYDRFRTWGVSGGGPHALACAALLPDRVIAAASLASAAPYDGDGLEFLAGMGEANIEEFGAAIAGEPQLRELLSQMRTDMLGTTPDTLADEMRSVLPEVDVAALTGDVGEFVHAWMTRGLGSGYEGWLDDDLAFVRSWGFDVADITVPVLLLQGRLDLMVPFDHGRWLAEHIPTVDARLTDDDGHITLIADIGPVHEWLQSH